MKKFKFKAKLIRHGKIDAAYVIFPYDVKENFGASRVKVKVKFDGVLYRGSLVRMGLAEGYPLIVTKEIRSKINKNAGDFVNVELEQDFDVRTVEVPEDFKKTLRKNKLDKAFEKMSYTHKKEYVNSILDAKKPETRLRRIENALVLIKAWAEKK
mgnify:CR=1 FL=1